MDTPTLVPYFVHAEEIPDVVTTVEIPEKHYPPASAASRAPRGSVGDSAAAQCAATPAGASAPRPSSFEPPNPDDLLEKPPNPDAPRTDLFYACFSTPTASTYYQDSHFPGDHTIFDAYAVTHTSIGVSKCRWDPIWADTIELYTLLDMLITRMETGVIFTPEQMARAHAIAHCATSRQMPAP